MWSRRSLIGIFVLLMAGSTSADTFSPSHSCIKPYKPYRFADEWEVTRFEGEVQRYKRCITDFVQEQNEEARRHQEAADDAIEEWNRFVRYELK